MIFDNSDGIYTINATNNGITSDDSLEFNGELFKITKTNGVAVISSPNVTDIDSLGKF